MHFQPDFLVLTLVLSVAGVCLVVAVLGLLTSRKHRPTLAKASAFLLLACACLGAVLQVSKAYWIPLAFPACILSIAWVARQPIAANTIRWSARQFSSSILSSGMLFAASTGLVVWTLWAMEPPDFQDDGIVAAAMGEIPVDTVEVEGISSRTDAGQPLPVFAMASVTESRRQGQESYETKLVGAWASPPRLLSLSPATNDCNCHGFVFAGGRYVIKGIYVNQILKENGYETVSSPRPNDIIVYRDGNDNVVHTGLVHSLTRKGHVIIESKWGRLGSYLHKVDDQPYGPTYTFYHSSRVGHMLAGLDGSAGEAAARTTGLE